MFSCGIVGRLHSAGWVVSCVDNLHSAEWVPSGGIVVSYGVVSCQIFKYTSYWMIVAGLLILSSDGMIYMYNGVVTMM